MLKRLIGVMLAPFLILAFISANAQSSDTGMESLSVPVSDGLYITDALSVPEVTDPGDEGVLVATALVSAGTGLGQSLPTTDAAANFTTGNPSVPEVADPGTSVEDATDIRGHLAG